MINVQLGIPVLLKLLSSTLTTLQSLDLKGVSADIVDGTWQEVFRLLNSSSTQLVDIKFEASKPIKWFGTPLAISYAPSLAKSDQYRGSIYSRQRHPEILRQPWYRIIRPHDIRALVDLYSSIDVRPSSQGQEPKYTDEGEGLQRCLGVRRRPRHGIDSELAAEAFKYLLLFLVIIIVLLFG